MSPYSLSVYLLLSLLCVFEIFVALCKPLCKGHLNFIHGEMVNVQLSKRLAVVLEITSSPTLSSDGH